MSELRDAAKRALAELGEGGEAAEIGAMTLEVTVAGVRELVSVSLRDGALRWTSTGELDGPHVRAALRLLAEGNTLRVEPEAGAERASIPGERGRRPSDPDADVRGGARDRLASALSDVVTAVGRAGMVAWDAPALHESLERLRADAPAPMPIGLARWLGRLREALDGRHVGLAARLLHGAAQLADDLALERPGIDARRRLVSWLGGESPVVERVVERISDRTLIEVGREWLAGVERGSIERRYLADLHNGEVFREERTRATGTISVGACPRTVTVGLAEVEDGAAPRRIRLLQYAVSLDTSQDDLRRVAANGYRRFGALADRYRDLVSAQPAQAEPFAVVVPRRWGNGAAVCFDEEDNALPLARLEDPAAVDVLCRRVPATGPHWIAGRLVDAQGTLMLVPCVAALPAGEGSELLRLR